MVTVADLVEIRTSLILDVLAYLDEVATLAAEVPDYYPAHLRSLERGVTAFDGIHQTVKLITNRREFDRWRADEMERLRRAGADPERLAYTPRWGTPDDDERDRGAASTKSGAQTVVWDERAAAVFPRAIVLGDPGFGKSWLLRYEVRRLARRAAIQLRERTATVDQVVVPIRLRLSELHRSKGAIQDTVVKLICEGRSERFQDLVQSKVGTARTVLLLDGWDEVTKNRARLQERLVRFARDFPQQPLLLASRIVGYDAPPIPGTPELELLSFDRRETESFVRVWFLDQRDGRAEGLLRLVDQNYTLRGLARIPLMLALMCRVYEANDKDFPERRGQLYEKCLRGLLRDWKQVRGRMPDNVVIEAALDRLCLAAFRLLRDGKEQFLETELAEALGFDWKRRPRQAQIFINGLKADGLFIAASQDGSELLFLHRTFQEYLAACWLAQQPWNDIAPFVDRVSWSPGWQEVLILFAGKLAQEKRGPTALQGFTSLLADARRDDLFRHRLALVTLCTAELPAPEASSVYRLPQVVEETFAILWNAQCEGTLEALPHFHGCWGALAAIEAHKLAEAPQTGVVAILLSRLRDGSPPGVREAAAEALRQMGAEAARHPGVVPTLLRFLPTNELMIRRRSEEALWAMRAEAAHRPDLICNLLDTLTDHPDSAMRISAATALGIIGEKTAQPSGVLEQLLRSLREDGDARVRETIARHLGWMGAEVDAHIDRVPALLRSLVGDADSDVRRGVAFGLGEMRADKAVPALIRVLAEDHDWRVRYDAAIALGKIGEQSALMRAEVVAALLRCLGREHVPNVRWSAANALGEVADDTIVGTLVCWVRQGRVPSVREDAAYALGAMKVKAARISEAVRALLDCLSEADSPSLRRIAVNALWEMGAEAGRQPGVVEALIRTLKTDRDAWVRSSAAGTLGALGGETQRERVVVSALLRALQLETDSKVRHSAAYGLQLIGPRAAQQPNVVSTLLRTLRRDSDSITRQNAARALEQMAAEVPQPKVVNALLDSLRTESASNVRDCCAAALGRLQRSGLRIFARRTSKQSRTHVRLRWTRDLAKAEGSRC